MSDGWYLRVRGKAEGPFDFGQLLALKDRGKLHRSNKLSTDLTHWFPATEVEGLFQQSMAAVPAGVPADSGQDFVFDANDSPPDEPPASEWYFVSPQSGDKKGPMTHGDMMELAVNRTIAPTTMVWRSGMEVWQPLSEVPELQPEQPLEHQALEAAALRPVGHLAGMILWSTVVAVVLGTALIVAVVADVPEVAGGLFLFAILLSLFRIIVLFTALHRLNWNARRLGAVDIEYTPAFTVWSFLIPVLSLFMPYLAVKQIYQASQSPLSWRQQPTPGIVIGWWIVWLLNSVFGLVVPWFDLPMWLLSWRLVHQIRVAQSQHTTEPIGPS